MYDLLVNISLYQLLLAAEFGFAFFVFILLYFINAPYGRHASKKWGPMIPAKVGWIAMEFPSFLIMVLFFFSGNTTSIVAIAFIIVWEIHYVQRTFIFPNLMRPGGKMPLIIAVFSVIFNGMNGYINGHHLAEASYSYDISWLADPRFIIGTLLFLIGFVINVHSDHVMRTLRKPGETEYKIPMKGLHRFVANPNYFGEILEWGGWALLTWSLPGLAFFLFTIANLVPRAHANRKWYRETFSDYPQERKRVIPFLY